MQQDGVAIRLGRRDLARTQRAARAADVFNDDLLAKVGRHVFGDQAANRIGRAAGRKRHDHGDLAVGIGLGEGGGCGQHRAGGKAGEFHV